MAAKDIVCADDNPDVFVLTFTTFDGTKFVLLVIATRIWAAAVRFQNCEEISTRTVQVEALAGQLTLRGAKAAAGVVEMPRPVLLCEILVRLSVRLGVGETASVAPLRSMGASPSRAPATQMPAIVTAKARADLETKCDMRNPPF